MISVLCRNIATSLALPNTIYELEGIRPDLYSVRVLAKVRFSTCVVTLRKLLYFFFFALESDIELENSLEPENEEHVKHRITYRRSVISMIFPHCETQSVLENGTRHEHMMYG